MTAKRNLLAVACAGVLCGAAAAQTPLFGGGRTTTTAPSAGLSTRPTVPAYSGAGSPAPLFPSATPPAAVTTQGPPALFPAPDTAATDVLTAPQGGVPTIPGAAYSPWVGADPAGTSGHGPITYEGYIRTGPSINIGGGELSAVLHDGLMTAAGARTLFFNASNDAAWVLDLGLSFTQNQGRRLERVTLVTASELKGADVTNTFTIPVGVRTIRRTSFNFGLGRDWWLYGPGTVDLNGGSGASNWRGGFDVGGRWGTSSIDLEPQDDIGGSRHRQGVFHGVFVGSTLNWEKQFGGCILQAGIRAEWGYDWTNLLPPQTSNLQNLNILMQFGLRY